MLFDKTNFSKTFVGKLRNFNSFVSCYVFDIKSGPVISPTQQKWKETETSIHEKKMGKEKLRLFFFNVRMFVMRSLTA